VAEDGARGDDRLDNRDTSLDELEIRGRIEKIHANTFHKKIVKIGPVAAEIYSVDLKKEEEILEGIARSASLLSGLKVKFSIPYTRYRERWAGVQAVSPHQVTRSES